MCGRFVSASDPSRVAAYFGAETDIDSLGENYNVAPTNDIMAVVSDADGNRPSRPYLALGLLRLHEQAGESHHKHQHWKERE